MLIYRIQLFVILLLFYIHRLNYYYVTLMPLAHYYDVHREHSHAQLRTKYTNSHCLLKNREHAEFLTEFECIKICFAIFKILRSKSLRKIYLNLLIFTNLQQNRGRNLRRS